MRLFKRPTRLPVTIHQFGSDRTAVLFREDTLKLTGTRGELLRVKFHADGSLEITPMAPWLEVPMDELRQWADHFDRTKRAAP